MENSGHTEHLKMHLPMKASAEDVPKIAEQIQVMLRKQGSKKGKRSDSRARATKREADEATGEEETAAKKGEIGEQLGATQA